LNARLDLIDATHPLPSRQPFGFLQTYSLAKPRSSNAARDSQDVPGPIAGAEGEAGRRDRRDLVEIAGCSESAVSVAVEECDPTEWAEAVYRPDILDRSDDLIRLPGYNPFE
jgi:4-oxalocrotonate tautomerase